MQTSNDVPTQQSVRAATFGFDVRVLESVLAGAPIVDRYPTIIGQGLSLSYLAQVFRQCLTGFRREYVDLLNELLEKDPHAFAVLSKRVETVSCAKLEVSAPEELDDTERAKADKYAQFASKKIKAIPNLTKALAALMWGEYYGVSAAEIHWDRSASEWTPTKLEQVHPRRLSYPDASNWALHVWDLGPVWGQTSAYGPVRSAGTWSPTQGAFGLRVDDYPGKFIVHTPQLRGDYPTREGIGRQIATWIVLKLIASRGASEYLERFARPWVEGIYSTKNKANDHKGREASKEDKDVLDVIMSALGTGGRSRSTHSDAVEIKLRTPEGEGATVKISFAEWIGICDSQMSKAVLSSTLTTEVGITGSRAVAQTQQEGEEKRYVFSSQMLADSLREFLVVPLIRLNFGDDVPMHLMPMVHLRTGEEPSPQVVLDKASKLVALGAPVDADAVADEVGVALIKKKNANDQRRLFSVQPAKVMPQAEQLALIGFEAAPAPADDGGQKPNDNKSGVKKSGQKTADDTAE